MRTTYISHDVIAGCFACNGNDYIWNSKNAQAVAARHHDATGHTTWVDVNMRIQYGENAGKILETPERVKK
jgi:hypothetical protein